MLQNRCCRDPVPQRPQHYQPACQALTAHDYFLPGDYSRTQLAGCMMNTLEPCTAPLRRF